jgi:hypothetical protein
MFTKIKSLLHRGKQSSDTIHRLRVDVEGISLDGIDPPRDRVAFGKIKQIIAYKRDMGTSDLVCFLVTFELGDQSVWNVTLHEDMPGFLEVDGALAQLPGYDTNWRERVVKPAFRTNETVIFEVAKVPGSSS